MFYVGLAPGTETGMSSSGVKGKANIKKGYTFSKVLNSVDIETAMCAGNQRETPRHPLPPGMLLSGEQHLMSIGLSGGGMSAISSCYAIVYCCYGCCGLCTGMGLSGGFR